MADPRRPVGLIGAPSARATRRYRLVLAIADTVGRGVFGFRVEVRGKHRLPRDAAGRPVGGWIAAAMPHRTWVDPFVVATALPVEPRLTFFGDGEAIFRSRWRRLLVSRLGGVIPIWPGANRVAIETYLSAAADVLRVGGVLCLFPETGPATPPGTARPFGSGLAYFALRTGAPIVPIILGGTDELFRGRRFRLEILESVTWQELADVPLGSSPPDAWSSAERRVAHRVTKALHARTEVPVDAAHRAALPPPGVPRQWTWLTTAWH